MDEALRLYRRALDLSPLFEDAERGIVTVQMLQDRHQEARQHLRQIYEEAPHDGFRSGIHFALAVTYADEGKYDLAVEELQKNFALSAKIHDSLAMAIDLNNMITSASARTRVGKAAPTMDDRCCLQASIRRIPGPEIVGLGVLAGLIGEIPGNGSGSRITSVRA